MVQGRETKWQGSLVGLGPGVGAGHSALQYRLGLGETRLPSSPSCPSAVHPHSGPGTGGPGRAPGRRRPCTQGGVQAADAGVSRAGNGAYLICRVTSPICPARLPHCGTQAVPLAKLGALLIRTLAKPVVNAIKRQTAGVECVAWHLTPPPRFPAPAPGPAPPSTPHHVLTSISFAATNCALGRGLVA
jgi:hypothetical protein